MVTGDAVSGTRLVQACSEPAEQRGYVNPPIVRASTVVYDDVGTMKVSQADPLRRSLPAYGRFGTPTTRAFEAVLSELSPSRHASASG